MSMPVTERALREATDRIDSLHKGLGLRHHDLRKRLGPDLRRLWGIREDDTLETVRARVVLQLEAALDTLTEPEYPIVIAATYNVGLEPPMREKVLGKRLEDLWEQEGDGFAKRTAERLGRNFRDELKRRLTRSRHPVPENLVAARVERERRTEALCAAIRELHDPVDEPALERLALSRFAGAEVCGPWSARDDVAIARTAAQGDWLCVFTRPPRLAAYRKAADTPWRPGHWTRRGAEVLQQAAGQPGVGILINPSARRTHAPPLPLAPSVVHRAAARLESS